MGDIGAAMTAEITGDVRAEIDLLWDMVDANQTEAESYRIEADAQTIKAARLATVNGQLGRALDRAGGIIAEKDARIARLCADMATLRDELARAKAEAATLRTANETMRETIAARDAVWEV